MKAVQIALLSVQPSIICSSCKKDEQIIEGCTDSSAINYLSNATSNNGSCIYAYDIAQGTWSISPDCDEIDLGLGVKSFVAYTMDFSQKYIEINSDYRS